MEQLIARYWRWLAGPMCIAAGLGLLWTPSLPVWIQILAGALVVGGALGLVLEVVASCNRRWKRRFLRNPEDAQTASDLAKRADAISSAGFRELTGPAFKEFWDATYRPWSDEYHGFVAKWWPEWATEQD